MEKIKVLLVDDQVLFVKSLKIVLEANTKDIEVVGIAYNGREALQILETTEVNIILLDIRMPSLDGVKTTKIVNELYPHIKIIILTTFDDDDYVYDALKNGAVGYLLKDIPPEELIAGIRAANNDTVLISPEIKSKLIKLIKPEDFSDYRYSILRELSRREREILSLMLEGLNNTEIANQLFISEQTVKNHIYNIYTKLGIHNRLQVIKLFKR